MFSKFFIDRPRFAMVISIIMIILGVLAIKILPISQFPSIWMETYDLLPLTAAHFLLT